jgi:CO dehydrogenase/acetyl-CoA synthase epsilon subunit
MAGIRIEFAQFGDFDSFDVIRSTSSMSIADVDLPSPIVTGLTTMYYIDTTVVVGARYYYKIRVWRDGVSAVSNEIQTIALSNVVICSDL